MITTSLKGRETLIAVDPMRQTILVVDDNHTNSADLCLVLHQAGYDVSTGNCTASIDELLALSQPQLIVLAVQVPEDSCLALCARVKQAEQPAFLPIIVVAAEDGAFARLASTESGVDAYLVRPIQEDEFLVQVRTLLNIRQRFEALSGANRQLTRDLEERNKQLENALKTTRELDVIKTAIVRNVSHELRTPLLQVKSAIALLDEEARAGLPTGAPFLLRLLSMAIQATGRLESTVANITQLAESQNLRLEAVVLNESVDLAIRNLERNWKSQDDCARIEKHYEGAIPLVRGDKRGIAQVLQHLLDNALKFSPQGGPVEIIIRPLDDGTVWVAVRDHGIGIAKRELKHIFEAFYQVDASTTRRFSGVGVGLTLAKLILDQMGSQLHVESAPGKGSTFSFTLPVYDPNEES